MTTARLTFPLVPRGRVIGLSFGTLRSLHRGAGTDIAGTRPYHPGDDMDAIDWAASARLSTAKGSDEFVVQERFAEEAPKVMIVCDRRPEMAYFAPPLPWLDKPAAMRQAIELVLASSGAAGGYVGYLDYADGDAHWRPPKGERKLLELRDERLMSSEFGGPQDWLERLLSSFDDRTAQVGPELASLDGETVLRGMLFETRGGLAWNFDNAVRWHLRPECLEVDALPRLCVVLRRRIFAETGYFAGDSGTMAGTVEGWADAEFSKRLRALGWRSVCNRSVTAAHPAVRLGLPLASQEVTEEIPR